jgi:SAM-dependent methyltransferase
MRNPEQIATNLFLADDGIWRTNVQRGVSYPVDGNTACRQIEDDSFWFRHRNRCILEVLRIFPPPGPLFDIGGGNGFVSLALQRAGVETVMVEPGPEGARNAIRRGVRTVICATIEDAGFLPGTLPAVGMFDVLEHIADEVSFLQTLHDRLVPGGRIYLAVPAFEALWSAEDVAAGHFRRYTIASVTRALIRSGFTVDYATYFFQWLWLPIFLFRTTPSWFGRPAARAVDDRRRQHRAPRGIVNRAIDSLLSREVRSVSNRQRIPFGSSCLVVATASGSRSV